MPTSVTKVAGVGLALVAVVSCGSAVPAPEASPARSGVLGYAEQRLLATDAALEPPAYPVRTNPDGSWLTKGANDWTSGFYAAALWKTYQRTGDPAWRQRAETWQAGLAPETAHDDTDLGFKLFDTYGVGYQLTGDESYKQVVLRAADTVARRYDPEVGMFRVWDHAGDLTQYQVNIDALMNLELMFWAGQNGGKPEYAAMAGHHALRALQDLVRPDGGTWMFGGYDQNTGALVRHYDPTVKQRDIDAARAILTSLSSPTYAPRNPGFAAMLQHGTQNLPHRQADTGIMFGDYYFVEALGRYEKTVGSTAAFMPE